MPNEPSSDPAPATTAQWKSRPVFISSTFRDMQWERDYLNRRVFPRLAEELAKRHHHLEPIDLRLGVEAGQAGSEEARELLVLKVCLDEIKRSRPFLLVLLGDRYGWVPPPERIETAAREQGMEKPEAGKSVTALEIEFGILRDPENPDQKSRSLFFFRQPLPYADMPDAVRADYSDAHSPDPQVRAGHTKLTDLKAALQRDPELAGRLHDYSVGWDPERNKVTDLEAFGNLVFEKLWAVIDAETKDWAAKPAPTWEEQERAGLAEFIEHRSRGFTGRADLLAKLHAIATSPTDHSSPTSSTDHRSLITDHFSCLTGTPGSGKSAVFAQLHRDLEKDSSLLILANAAGGTQRGSSVDSMLRRWIGEMHSFLEPVEPPKPEAVVPSELEPQVADSGPKPNSISFRRKPKQIAGPLPSPRANRLPANASNDDVEAAFYSLLHRVSSQRRVVVLLDALDQAEPTPRGRHLTSFKPQQWPPNARLIATAIPGTASSVLAKAPGTAEFDLPSLTADDAKDIGTHVWGRYHRSLNPAVLAVLIEKPLPDGTPACGNPLWLTLALEQLNLLDADDFARAERDFTGSPGERLAALLLDTARNMPPDIESLYGWLLEQNEKAFGLAETRAFATAIALSRSGWREADLLDLVPRLSPHFKNQNSTIITHQSSSPSLFDPLALASLRRSFRAHIVRRGEHEQLDFFHAQMRRAVLARCAPDVPQQRAIHAATSDYLESLPASDPLIRLERMRQLIGERNAERAGAYYATIKADSGDELTAECLGSTWTLVEWIADAERLAHASPVLRSLQGEVGSVPPAASLVLHNPQGDEGRGRDLDADPSSNPHLAWITSWLADPTLSHDQIYQLAHNFQFGLLERMTNDVALAGRLHLAKTTRYALDRLTTADSANIQCRYDLSVCNARIGDMLSAQGDLPAALKAFRDSLDIAQSLANEDPGNATMHYNLSSCLIGIGDALSSQGNLAEALKAFNDSLDVAQHMVALLEVADNESLQRDFRAQFFTIYDRIGKVQRTQGDLMGALETFRNSLTIAQHFADADQSNDRWQSSLSVGHVKIGEVLCDQGDLPAALKAFRDSLTIAQRLAAADPGNAGWQRGMAASLLHIGVVLRLQGDLPGALKAFREANSIIQRMAEADQGNAEWQRDISIGFNKIGDVLSAQGDLTGALKAFQNSLIIIQRLADADPSNSDWQNDLAVSHDLIGKVLRAKGNLLEALNAFRVASSILQRLTNNDSSNLNLQQNHSVGLMHIGDVLREQGDLPGALKEFRDSHAVIQSLADGNPGHAELQCNLAVSQEKIGDVLRAQGDLSSALHAFRESLDIRKRLASAAPRNVVWQSGISKSFANIGDVFRAQGDLPNALNAFKESLDIRKRLADAVPSNAEMQRDLAVSFANIGDVLNAQGDLAGALWAFRNSLPIFQRLAEGSPDHAGWQRDIYVTQSKIGDVLRAQGDLPGALKAFRDSLDNRKRSAAAPGNADGQRDLASSIMSIGGILRLQGDLTGALREFRDSHAIIRRLADANDENAGWQHDLSVIHEKIGDVLRAQGDLPGALKAFRDSFAIRNRLAVTAPGNAGWQHDLSASHEQIGDVLRAQVDLAGALRAYREALGVRERLATAAPSNAAWQRDLVVIYAKMANAEAQNRPGDGREWWHKAYTQLSSMKQRGIMLPTDEGLLATLKAKAEGSEQTTGARRKDRVRLLVFWVVWLLLMGLVVWLITVSAWFWVMGGPLLLIGLVALLILIPSVSKRVNAWVAEQQRGNQ